MCFCLWWLWLESDNNDYEKDDDGDDNEEDDNGDEKESDDNALSITQGKCHPANMQRLCTFSPAGPSILYAKDELIPYTYNT